MLGLGSFEAPTSPQPQSREKRSMLLDLMKLRCSVPRNTGIPHAGAQATTKHQENEHNSAL